MSKIQTEDLKELKSELDGEVLVPGEAEYDEARKIWNSYFDRKPAVIVQCAHAGDVANAVTFAADLDLVLSIKGGGHNSAGTAMCDDGVCIDLSMMRQVTVDAKAGRANVGGGALLSDVDAATQKHGLAVSSGIVSHTGVGGLTTGGGFGWISRKYGMSVDNLVSAEVVTSEGDVVKASEDENSDLFWGIRGGGGNFGVVTSFEFQTANIGTEIYSGLIVKKFSDLKKYIQFHREYVRTLPDNMTVWMVTRTAPPLPFLPADVHGKLVVIVPFVFLGSQAEGEKFIKPIQDATPSVGEHFGMNPYSGWQQAFDPLVPHGARNYWKTHQLTDLPDGYIDVVEEFALKLPSPLCEIFMPHLEGAPSRISETATAFAHRKPPFNMNIHTRWENAADDKKCLEWCRALHAAAEPYAQGMYVNFLSDMDEAQAKKAYTPIVWNRLTEVKKKWDPSNLFRMNQNIKPSA